MVGEGFVTLTIAVLLALPPTPEQSISYVFVPTVSGVTVSVPEVPFEPDQSPEAEQLVAFVLDQVRSEVFPKVIDEGVALIVAVGTRGITEKVCELDVPPPGADVVTVICAVVVEVNKSPAGIVASNCVGETYEVDLEEPLK